MCIVHNRKYPIFLQEQLGLNGWKMAYVGVYNVDGSENVSTPCDLPTLKLSSFYFIICRMEKVKLMLMSFNLCCYAIVFVVGFSVFSVWVKKSASNSWHSSSSSVETIFSIAQWFDALSLTLSCLLEVSVKLTHVCLIYEWLVILWFCDSIRYNEHYYPAIVGRRRVSFVFCKHICASWWLFQYGECSCSAIITIYYTILSYSSFNMCDMCCLIVTIEYY